MTLDGIDVRTTLASDTYRAINPIDLPRLDRAEFMSGHDGIYVEPPGKPREFWRYGAAFVDDPDQVGLFSGGIGSACYVYPPAFTAAINDATLVGHRTILSPRKEFFVDEGYAEPSVFQHQLDRISRSDSFSNEGTGLRPTGRERLFQFDRAGRALRRLEGNTLVLCSGEPQSYGSFLFRVLPKIKAVRDLGLTHLPCLAYSEPAPFMDLLDLCGVPARNIVPHEIDVVTQIDRAFVPCLRNPHAYLDPESFELFAELRASNGSPQSRRKIYVSRFALNQSGRGASRIMLNEGEVIVELQKMGFDIVEPENLSVQDQIKIFSSASVVVGPSGSGLFNTMFCHPATKVIDLQSEPHWIYSYTGMYSSLKLDYGIFVGRVDPEDKTPIHRQWTVNVDALVSRIKTFMAEW
jgi:capsular polysaccharide biosynthesis protein